MHVTVPRAFDRDAVSENVISVPRAEGGRQTQLPTKSAYINPLGTFLPVVLMDCTQPPHFLTRPSWDKTT
jgi:hypothetical protein